ncbi:MAG: SPOR domain-containing protein [Pseudomonadota bacterium]
MNGPQRPLSSSTSRTSASAGRRDRAMDVYDELDQFVDSEPAGWADHKPGRRASSLGDAAASADDADNLALYARAARRADLYHDDDPGEAAFSRAPARSRREAFAQRLNEELTKPPRALPEDEDGSDRGTTAQPYHEHDGPTVSPRIGNGHDGHGPRTPMRTRATPTAAGPVGRSPAGGSAAGATKGSGPSNGSRGNGASHPGGLGAGHRAIEGSEAAAARATPSRRVPPPSPPMVDADDAPADSLDWELDNAIGAIVANNRRVQATQGDDAPARDLAGEGASTQQPGQRAAGPGGAELSDASLGAEPTADGALAPQEAVGTRLRPGHVSGEIAARPSAQEPGKEQAPPHKSGPALSRPIGALKRLRPIPTFSFNRREDPDANDLPQRADPDNPLSDVFFQDVRAQFDAVHPEPVDTFGGHDPNGQFGDDPGEVLADHVQSVLGDEYEILPDEEARELPPSLRREGGARGSSLMRGAGLAVVVAGVAVLSLAVVVGINVFAGSTDTGGAGPPVIRADARDVREWPADIGIAAEPDILERTSVEETAALVLPDRVDITNALPPSSANGSADEELITRRVGTLEVRPDGTIVTAGASSGFSPSGSVRAPAEELPVPGIERVASPGTGNASDLLDDLDVVGGEDPAGQSAARAPAQDASSAFDPPAIDTPSVRTSPWADPGSPDPSSIDPSSTGPSGADPWAAEPGPREASPSDPFGDVTADGNVAVVLALPRPRPAPPPRRTAPVRATPAVATPAFTSQDALSTPWGVQISAQRSMADAERSMADLKSRFPSLIGAADPKIVAADVAGKGRYYRVRIGASSRTEAANLCDRIKNAGADCFIGPNR